MDYLNTLIEKDRHETYLARKNILEDLIEQTFKILKSSTDSDEIKEEAEKLVDYRLQLIDVNKHLHNIYYLDIANEALPENIYENNLFDSFEIMYKKQIRLHDTVKACYCFDEDTHKVVIKSLDDKKIHAIVILK